ncbi:citrate/2-methylcitrate synthase [Corallococcus sp. RDP092CA]|uniref:citrate/2-methylcitrate synthase n=1 Tax=Corallococcus sp. RDP092CA TaxID=3109369 RepID=UPI0035B157CD
MILAKASEQSEMLDVEALIASVLQLDPEAVTDELEYQSVVEWDSLQHVVLMVALEKASGIRINGELRVQLSSVKAIREFVQSGVPGRCAPKAVRVGSEPKEGLQAVPAAPPTIHRGLEGVHFDRTSIARIDGERSALEYRGYAIRDLVEHSSFEETTYLLVMGELPGAAALAAFRRELEEARAVPASVLSIVGSLASAHPMEALRTGVSALGALDPERADHSKEASLRKGVRLVAQIPLLIAAHQAARERRPLPLVPPGISHASYLLHLVRGEAPSALDERLIDTDLIVHADHGSNASAFTARVAVGCRAGMHAAITAAISVFAGTIHGGAAEAVTQVLDVVGTPERARAYVASQFEQGLPVMGFGHRVYRGEDPRVGPLRDAAREASSRKGDMRGFEIITALVEAMKPYARHGIEANVDLYVGLLYRMLGLSDELAVPMFVAGRIAGWVAQAREQESNNVLIRPLLHYVGAASRAHPGPGGLP